MAEYQVLYAEDEFTNRKLLEIQLGKSGISCDLASDGTSAYQKFQENQYQVIILDQYMPGMNGDVLARLIRETKPDIPLIAITSDDAETENLKKAGFSEVFIKPLRNKEYIEVIRKYLDGGAR
jgi:two-component system response regulator ResD